jgi:hypothetical protein
MSAPKTPVSMTIGPRAVRAPRLQSGEEGGAFLLAEVVDDHRIMRRQGAGASDQLLDRKLKVLAAAGLNGLLWTTRCRL